ncbi:MAG: hypothetical protein KIS67_28870 [Verrucomicrobiae bacterium]|nr:hypothetical protein [Verrucomicrobiae bacterium]
MSDVTHILERAQQGESCAAEELLPLVYDELRRLAAAKMAHEAVGQTLQPTALVHEAWLRLGADAQPTWQNRAHFFGAAAEAISLLAGSRVLQDDDHRGHRLLRTGQWNLQGLADGNQGDVGRPAALDVRTLKAAARSPTGTRGSRSAWVGLSSGKTNRDSVSPVAGG